MAIFSVNKNPDRAELRKFGRTMLIGFGVLGAIFWYFSSRGSDQPGEGTGGFPTTTLVLWGLGVALFVVGYGPMPIARVVYVGWMTAAMYIGMVVLPVSLTLLFLIVLPIFSLIRLADPMRRKLRREGSYWEEYKPYDPTVDRMLRPF